MANIVGEWKFDELTTATDGTIIRDSWGGINNGTLDTYVTTADPITNKVSTDCVSGKCLSFDGSDDYIETTGIAISANMTWSVWVKAIETKAEFILDHRTSDVGVQPFYTNAAGSMQFYDSVVGSSLLTADGVFKFDSNWHFLTAVGTASSRKLYYDGVEAATVGTGINPQTARLVNVGIRFSHDGVSKFKGSVDDIRIYNAAVSASQIKEQYYAGLNNLLISGGITKEEYVSKMSEIGIR